MDQELIAYLDVRFRETQRQIAEVQQQLAGFQKDTVQRFEQVDRRFEQVDRRLEQVDQRLNQVEAEVRQVQDAIHFTQIKVEHLEGHIQVIAEGHAGLASQLQDHREEVKAAIAESTKWVEPVFRDLDARYKNLDGRTSRLESWAAQHPAPGLPQ